MAAPFNLGDVTTLLYLFHCDRAWEKIKVVRATGATRPRVPLAPQLGNSNEWNM